MGAIMQNGQPGNVMGGAPSPQQDMHSIAQSGANPGQQQVQNGY
jgi:hypothetical protein